MSTGADADGLKLWNGRERERDGNNSYCYFHFITVCCGKLICNAHLMVGYQDQRRVEFLSVVDLTEALSQMIWKWDPAPMATDKEGVVEWSVCR